MIQPCSWCPNAKTYTCDDSAMLWVFRCEEWQWNRTLIKNPTHVMIQPCSGCSDANTYTCDVSAMLWEAWLVFRCNFDSVYLCDEARCRPGPIVSTHTKIKVCSGHNPGSAYTCDEARCRPGPYPILFTHVTSKTCSEYDPSKQWKLEPPREDSCSYLLVAVAQSVTSEHQNWGHQLEVTTKRKQLATVPHLFVPRYVPPGPLNILKTVDFSQTSHLYNCHIW